MVYRRVFRRKKEGEERVTLPYGLAIALGVVWAELIKLNAIAGF